MASRRCLTACAVLVLALAAPAARARDAATQPATTRPADASARKWRGFPFSRFTPARSPERRSAKIGDGPEAIVRVSETRRETVLKELGTPSYSTRNDLAFGYLFAVRTGTVRGLLFGPCSVPLFGRSDVWEEDDVWLEFDRDGLLKRVEKRLIKRHGTNAEAAWREFAKDVPDEIRPEQMRGGKP